MSPSRVEWLALTGWRTSGKFGLVVHLTHPGDKLSNSGTGTATRSGSANSRLIGALAAKIEQVLRELLKGSSSYALLDFPNYSNVGDSAIWLGSRACLKRLGVRVSYVCDLAAYEEREMASHIGQDTTILLQGGGNFGDIYPWHQRFREEVIRSFPSQRIIMLPQSIFFQSREHLLRAKAIFNAHPRLTILLRDHQSLEFVKREFRAPSHLCPDMAFGLGTLMRSSPPAGDLLALLRIDNESRLSSPPTGLASIDWPQDSVKFRRLSRLLTGQEEWIRPLWRKALLTRAAAYDLLARRRLSVGRQTLSRGKVVITDRLHGHLLCLLMNIPHVVLDNSYGKIRSLYDTWTKDSPLVHWADSLPEAVAMSENLIRSIE